MMRNRFALDFPRKARHKSVVDTNFGSYSVKMSIKTGEICNEYR